MGLIKEYLKATMDLFICCIYPLMELYTFLVFCGMFCFDETFLPNWVVVVIFLVYNYIYLYKTVIFLRIYTIDDKSTMDLFPQIKQFDTGLYYKNINPYAVQSIRNESVEQIQMCDICETYKPPRTHHCNQNNKCYLKYDHYCLMLGSPIGYHNYKDFYLFLAVNCISCILFMVFSLLHLLTYPHPTKVNRVNYIFTLSIVFVELVVIGGTLIFHTILICNNETAVENQAIESYLRGDLSYAHVFQTGPMTTFSRISDRKKLNPYNLGLKNNWLEVFGDNPWYWLKPVFSSRGNGLLFKLNNTTNEDSNTENELELV